MKNKLNILAVFFICIIITSAVITIVGSSTEYSEPMRTINIVLSNPYVSGVLYTVGLVFIVFAVQIAICKNKIKKDFRCNEIMSELYDGIIDFQTIINDKNPNGTYKEFVEVNKTKLFFVKLALSYENNDLLIESLNQCFFLNLNFELLSIINHIKNRLPNIRQGNDKVISFLDDQNNNTPQFNEFDANQFITDLRFLAQNWGSLLNYLNYDNAYARAVSEYYNNFFNNLKFTSVDDMAIRIKMIQKTFHKEIKKEIRKKRKEFRNGKN